MFSYPPWLWRKNLEINAGKTQECVHIWVLCTCVFIIIKQTWIIDLKRAWAGMWTPVTVRVEKKYLTFIKCLFTHFVKVFFWTLSRSSARKRKTHVSNIERWRGERKATSLQNLINHGLIWPQNLSYCLHRVHMASCLSKWKFNAAVMT